MHKALMAVASAGIFMGSVVAAAPAEAASSTNWYVEIQVISMLYSPSDTSAAEMKSTCKYVMDYKPGDKVKVTADGRTLGLASLKMKPKIYKEKGFSPTWSCVYYANVPVKSNSASFYEVTTGDDAPEDVTRRELVKRNWRLEWGYVDN